MMFVITEDHGTDDYMEILAVTNDEGVAQEMVLAFAEEAMYNSFCEDLCSFSPHRTSVTEIIESYTRKFRLNSFGWSFYYEKVPFIN
jgi:hypothetical protein